jgi:hypothetical protein
MSIIETLNNSSWDGTVAADLVAVQLPPGVYNGMICDYTVKHLGEKGTPGLLIKIDVTDGQYKGAKVYKTWWLTDKSLPYVARDLKALGHPISKAADVLNLKLEGTDVQFKYGIKREGDEPGVLWVSPLVRAKGAAQVGTQETEDAIPF